MDDSTSKAESKSKRGSLFEALSLVSITLLLIGSYLYASGSIAAVWLTVFGILVLVGMVGSIGASYHNIDETRRIAATTKFRISRQLIETLIAKQIPTDVIFGLKKMIRNGDVMVEGETLFTNQLESCFGKERSSEVQGIIMKYARVPDDEFALLIVQPEPNGGPPPPALQEKAASAAI